MLLCIEMHSVCRSQQYTRCWSMINGKMDAHGYSGITLLRRNGEYTLYTPSSSGIIIIENGPTCSFWALSSTFHPDILSFFQRNRKLSLRRSMILHDIAQITLRENKPHNMSKRMQEMLSCAEWVDDVLSVCNYTEYC